MRFIKKCLFCGQPNNTINYSCSCSEADWHKEYRTLDIEVKLEDQDLEQVRNSVNAYSFYHPKGMLQYTALPFRTHAPKCLDRIGLTPLHHLRTISEEAGCRVFIKDEGDNPSGCFKDRESIICLLNTRRRNLNHATIYSSGNAAASAALLAQKLGLEFITVVAGDTYEEKIDFIRDHGSAVIVIGDEETSFEEGFRIFAHLNAQGVFARYGYDNWSVRNPYRAQGDKTTAVEIYKQLQSAGIDDGPDYVLVPSANGTHLVGLWKGFKELQTLGFINQLPKMIPVGIAHANPIVKAAREGITERPLKCDLRILDEQDAYIGSTIIAEEGYDSVEATKAVLESGGFGVGVHTSDIQRAMIQFMQLEKGLALHHAILPEPTSYISLAAIEYVKNRKDITENEVMVSLITGHGMKALEVTEELLNGEGALQQMVRHIAREKERSVGKKAGKKGPRINVEADFDKVAKAFYNLKNKLD